MWIPKVAACRRNLGLLDGIPMGLEEELWSTIIGPQSSDAEVEVVFANAI